MVSFRKTILSWFLAIAILFSSSNYGYTFNIGEEREIGEKLLYSVRTNFNLIDDPDLTQYLSQLGQSVLEVAGFQYFDYRFFIINDKEFNAFAAPSGLIFFYSGLISAMNSEDELVSVLAHEIGHIVKRHLADRIEKGTYSSIASLGLAMAAIAFGGATAPVLLTGALATGQSLNLYFSREHEEEADLLAYSWMKKLHRHPEGQAKMLETMRRIARYRSEKLPQYLLTHPNPEARLHYIQSLLDIDHDDNPPDTGLSKDKELRFLRFKYRILSKVQDLQAFKAYLATRMSSSRGPDYVRNMASYGLALVAEEENNHKRALKLMDEVIEAYPQQLIFHLDKARMEIESGYYDVAEKSLRRVLDKNTSEVYASYLLGRLYKNIGRFEEAEEYFKTVSYKYPEYSKVYFELGEVASFNKQGGRANFYLGKHNLYEGKLKAAKFNFKAAEKDPNLEEEYKKECAVALKKIDELKK